MTDSTKAWAHASEIKFVLDPRTAENVRAWARSFLEPDPHGTGPFGDAYRTATLYLDTADGHVFYRRGSFGRAKYRIRRYADSDVIFLERKLRQPGVLVKRRTRVPLDALERQSHADNGKAHGGMPSGDWFHRRIAARRLDAVCQLSYDRLARGVVTSAGLARLTLDTSISVLPVSGMRFSSKPGLPVLADRLILELKFRSHLPAIFKRLIEEFALSPQTVSKYRVGMAAIGSFGPCDAGMPSEAVVPSTHA